MVYLACHARFPVRGALARVWESFGGSIAQAMLCVQP